MSSDFIGTDTHPGEIMSACMHIDRSEDFLISDGDHGMPEVRVRAFAHSCNIASVTADDIFAHQIERRSRMSMRLCKDKLKSFCARRARRVGAVERDWLCRSRAYFNLKFWALSRAIVLALNYP